MSRRRCAAPECPENQIPGSVYCASHDEIDRDWRRALHKDRDISDVILAARALEAFCAEELRAGADKKSHVMSRPAKLIDELRFFLDIHAHDWRHGDDAQ